MHLKLHISISFIPSWTIHGGLISVQNPSQSTWKVNSLVSHAILESQLSNSRKNVFIWPERTLGSLYLKDLVNLTCLKNGDLSLKDCVFLLWKIAGFFYFERLLILSFWKNKQSFKIKEPAIFHSENTQSFIERTLQSLVWSFRNN